MKIIKDAGFTLVVDYQQQLYILTYNDKLLTVTGFNDSDEYSSTIKDLILNSN